MKNLERAVQVCVDVANHILAVHEYESLDYGRIYDAVTQGLGLFEDYARAILTYLKTL